MSLVTLHQTHRGLAIEVRDGVGLPQRIEFEREAAPIIAAMLADECDDNSDRYMVRDAWSLFDDFDLEPEDEQ